MPCYPTKIDAGKNQRRFYSLHLAPDLFGGWSLVREWGRLGSGGTVRHDPFETEQEAQLALDKICSSKQVKDYVVVSR